MAVTKILLFGCVDGAAQSTPVYMKVTDNGDGTCSLGTTAITTAAANSVTNITTATTTLVKTGSGTLERVNINSLGTVASTVKIYDGITAGGTLVGTINSLAVLGTVSQGFSFAVGLCIVTTGTVAPDVTVIWR